MGNKGKILFENLTKIRIFCNQFWNQPKVWRDIFFVIGSKRTCMVHIISIMREAIWDVWRNLKIQNLKIQQKFKHANFEEIFKNIFVFDSAAFLSNSPNSPPSSGHLNQMCVRLRYFYKFWKHRIFSCLARYIISPEGSLFVWLLLVLLIVKGGSIVTRNKIHPDAIFL